MSTISYAIEITSDATAITDTNFGCVAGIFRFITGRPGYTGAPTYPKWEDDTDNTAVWYEDWITREGIGNPSRNVSIEISGEYGALSGFDFSVQNTTKFWNFLNTNSINLTNRVIKLYAVIDDKFYQIWDGVISETPYDETHFKFTCLDSFRRIHSQIPPNIIGKTSNPDTTDSSQGKPIPTVMGDVSYVKLIENNYELKWETIWKSGSKDMVVTAAHNYYSIFRSDNRAPGKAWGLFLHCPGTYPITTNMFQNMYVFAVSGPAKDLDRGYKIYSNSWHTTQYNGDRVFYVELREPIPDFSRDNCIYKISGTGAEAISTDTTIFSIAQVAIKGILSEDSISSITKDVTTGLPYLYNWDDVQKKFIDIRASIVSYDLTDNNTVKHPYVEIAANNVTSGRGFKNVFPIKPTINFVSTFSYPHQLENINEAAWNNIDLVTKVGLQFVGYETYVWRNNFVTPTALNNVFDSDRNTEISYVFTEPNNNFIMVRVNIDIESIVDTDFEDIFFGIDTFFSGVTTSPNYIWYNVGRTIRLKDIYGNVITDIESDIENMASYSPYSPQLDDTKFNLLSEEYYRLGGDDADEGDYFYNQAEILKIPSDIADYIKNKTAATNIDFYFSYYNANANPVGSKPFNALTEIHIREFGVMGVKTIDLSNGDVYARISGETTTNGSLQTNNVYSVFKKILEDYDGIATANIDYGNVSTCRNTWQAGRQLTERKSSFEYLNELCKQSFVCLVPTRTGKRRLTAWREDTTLEVTHNSNSILRGSITEYKDTPMSSLYNNFVLNYSWNPATEKFDRVLYITNISEASFPDSTTTIWKDWVGGDENISWADAKNLWDTCHASYLNHKVESPELSSDLKQLFWYNDTRIFNASASSGWGMDASAYKFLVNLVEWTTRLKKQTQYRIPLNATNLALELLQPVIFNDPILSNGVDMYGWITGIEFDTKESNIIIKSTIEPVDVHLVYDGMIDESGSRDTTIDEDGVRTDQISETGEV